MACGDRRLLLPRLLLFLRSLLIDHRMNFPLERCPGCRWVQGAALAGEVCLWPPHPGPSPQPLLA